MLTCGAVRGCQVAGLARAMRGKCVRVHTGGSTLDIVGTGGDGANTVNISTGACVLAAACGAKVAKVSLNLNLNMDEVESGPWFALRCIEC